MAHPLDGTRLKVVRAKEHLDTLKSESLAWLNTQPHEVRSQPAINGDNQVLPQLTPDDPPLRLSAIVGDVVTNARAALDYIAWELAQRYFVPRVNLADSHDRRITSFPLFNDATAKGLQDRFNRLAKRHIPTSAIANIEAVQPYNAGYASLWRLHELVNKDKHRMPLLTVRDFDDVLITLATPPIYQALIKEAATLVVPRHREANSVTMESNVQMKAEYPFYVAFEDVAMPREPLDRTLEQIITTVDDIIRRFEGFFA